MFTFAVFFKVLSYEIQNEQETKRVWLEFPIQVHLQSRLCEDLMSLWLWLSSYINRLLTEREGRTGEYWPEVVAVRTERSEVRTATTEGQYSPVRPEQARLVSGLLYGTLFLIVKCNFKNAL